MMNRFRAPQRSKPSDTRGFTRESAAQLLDRNRERIAELQNTLYAESERSLLVVLQSMDTGGKDPIIRDVLSAANPQACRVTAFKKAGGAEKRRDRFRRFHQEVPGKGEIGVFNRSYFDEIIFHDAHGELDADALRKEYERILLFEEMLVSSGVTVVKIFLDISKGEQKRRLQARMDDPERHWELSESDFSERQFWDGYMLAFDTAIRQTNPDWAPWFIIPSDASWFRDAAASIIIAGALEGMNPKYPPAKLDLSKVELTD